MAIRTKRLLDFGPDVPVAVSPEAKAFLSELPQLAVRAFLDALQEWAKDRPVKAARVYMYTDMEDETWTEAEIDLLLDTDDDDEAFALVEQMGAALDAVRQKLGPAERTAVDHNVGIQPYWGDDWNDEPSAV
jgi:hypothetical protein